MLQILLVAAALLSPPAGVQQTGRIDFIAIGSDGETVKDLSARDMTLKVGGKDRPLTSLEFIPTHDGGRNILIYVDEPTLQALEPIVKNAIEKLLGSLQPSDRIAYVSTRRGQLTPLTAERRDSVRNAVATMQTGPGELFTCLSDMAKNIESLARALPPGRATTIAVLSRGADEDPEFGSHSATGCAPRQDLLRSVADAVSAAQINLHYFTVHPNSESWGLQSLAGNTGGLSDRLSWSDHEALQRAIVGPSGFYRASFSADDSASGRPQRVELRTTRKKVKVRTSPTVVIRSPAS